MYHQVQHSDALHSAYKIYLCYDSHKSNCDFLIREKDQQDALYLINVFQLNYPLHVSNKQIHLMFVRTCISDTIV